MENPIEPPPARDRYPIQNNDNNRHYFTAGVDGRGRQALMGAQLPEVVTVFFNESGDYLETVAKTIAPRPGEDDDAAADRTLEEVQSAIGLAPATIFVKKFRLGDRWIGIEDLPEHYQEFLDNPEEFDEREKVDYPEDIRQWISDGAFVLWWCEDFYLDKDGDITSS